jgi:hypothetical protein
VGLGVGIEGGKGVGERALRCRVRTGAGDIGGGAGITVELSAAPDGDGFSNVGLLSPGADVLVTLNGFRGLG